MNQQFMMQQNDPFGSAFGGGMQQRQQYNTMQAGTPGMQYNQQYQQEQRQQNDAYSNLPGKDPFAFM